MSGGIPFDQNVTIVRIISIELNKPNYRYFYRNESQQISSINPIKNSQDRIIVVNIISDCRSS